MSVSTEYSIQTESQLDPQSESTSMISFDMSQPYSPTSASKHFKVGSVSIYQRYSIRKHVFSFTVTHNSFSPTEDFMKY